MQRLIPVREKVICREGGHRVPRAVLLVVSWWLLLQKTFSWTVIPPQVPGPLNSPWVVVSLEAHTKVIFVFPEFSILDFQLHINVMGHGICTRKG